MLGAGRLGQQTPVLDLLLAGQRFRQFFERLEPLDVLGGLLFLGGGHRDLRPLSVDLQWMPFDRLLDGQLRRDDPLAGQRDFGLLPLQSLGQLRRSQLAFGSGSRRVQLDEHVTRFHCLSVLDADVRHLVSDQWAADLNDSVAWLDRS